LVLFRIKLRHLSHFLLIGYPICMIRLTQFGVPTQACMYFIFLGFFFVDCCFFSSQIHHFTSWLLGINNRYFLNLLSIRLTHSHNLGCKFALLARVDLHFILLFFYFFKSYYLIFLLFFKIYWQHLNILFLHYKKK
jgi:hypothetical protein